MSDSLRTLGLQHARLLCPSLSPGVCSNSCPLSQWCSLTISYSTTPLSPVAFNLSQHQGLFQWVGPWFMDLTFQVPVQYHSLQRWTLLSPPDTSTTKHHFRFGPAASFFLELLVIALCSSPVAYWTTHWTFRPGGLIFQYYLFFHFHSVHGVLQARILEWVAVSSSSGSCFFRALSYDPSILGGHAQHCL